jgi:hypothetical protein
MSDIGSSVFYCSAYIVLRRHLFVSPRRLRNQLFATDVSCRALDITRRYNMARGMLLWLIGIPIPIILLVWLLGGLH